MDAGYRAARGEVILFLHADTRLEEGWADALRGALEEPGVSGGAFLLRFDSGGRIYRVLERGARLRSRLARLPYGDQAIFVRREVLDRLGGIPDAPIFEDLDLVRAIRRSGRLVLLPLAARTSARRYERAGPLRAMLRNWLALGAYLLNIDRERVAGWYGRRPDR
jgi:GT2 family glycosyltransferase